MILKLGHLMEAGEVGYSLALIHKLSLKHDLHTMPFRKADLERCLLIFHLSLKRVYDIQIKIIA